MKLTRMLIVALSLMLIGTTATYAAVFFTTTSTADQMAPNAETGLAGDIALSAISAGSLAAGEIVSINYGGAQISILPTISVTVGAATCAAGSFTVYGATVACAGGATAVNATVNPTNILLSFPAGFTFAADQVIRVSGVRVNVVPVTGGSTTGGSLNATISSVLGSATLTNPTTSVATFVEPITVAVNTNAFGVPLPIQFSTAATAIANSVVLAGNTVATNGVGTVIVSEAGTFTNAFETITAAPTQIIFQIQNIPVGLAIQSATLNTTLTSPTVTAAVENVGGVTGFQTGTTATFVVDITNQRADLLEKVAVDVVFAKVTGTTTIAATSASNPAATIQATLGPAATNAQLANIALPNAAAGITGTGLPWAPGPLRYAPRYVPSPGATFITVNQLLTELLSVFNVFSSSFNTGFAVANTSIINCTGGCAGNSLGIPVGVPAQLGTITVTLYPSDGSAAKSFTTSATNKPGLGLDANGNLPAGATWSVLLSDLLTPAGVTGNAFQGMARFTCNFSNAHGINFIADPSFSVQAQGYEMLVLTNPLSSRAVGIEGLGH